MKSPNVFLDLPDPLVVELIVKWIDVKYLGRVDSACCNRSQELRAELHRVFGLQMTILPQLLALDCGEQQHINMNRYLQWHTRRKVKAGRIYLNGCHINVDTVLRFFVAVGGPHVHTVHLTHVFYGDLLAIVPTIAELCTRVEHFAFSSCNVTTQGVMAVMNASSSTMRSLYIHNCKLAWNKTALTGLQWPYLSSLVLDCDIEDGVLQRLLEATERLQVLSLRGTRLTNDCVDQLCRVAPTLHKLGLQRCRGLTDEVLERLAAAGCRHLTQLILHSQDRQVTDRGVVALTSQCPQLHAIYLAVEVGGAALEAIAEHCGGSLRHLCLEGVVLGEEQGEEGARALARHCRQLESLGLVDCVLGSVEALAGIIAAQTGLSAISLDYSEIGDAALQAVATHHASLISLSLFRATDFTSSVAVELLQRCAQLTELSVTRDSKLIPDRVLAPLLDRQPTLRIHNHHAYPPYWREVLPGVASDYAFRWSI